MVSDDVLRVQFSQVKDFPLANPLYVRPCYEQYCNLLLSEAKSPHMVLLTGSPGIGKSSFAVYVLWRLVVGGREGPPNSGAAVGANDWRSRWRNIYWVRGESTGSYMVTRGSSGGFSVRLHNFRVTQMGEDDILLHDITACEPMPTVQLGLGVSFCSPHPRRLKEPSKPRYAEVWYMPTWTLAELNELSVKVLGGGMEEGTIVAWRYDRFGGKPRYIFEKRDVYDTMLQKGLDGAPDYKYLLKIVDHNAEAGNDVASILTAINPEPHDLRNSSVTWASEYVANTIVERFTEAVEADLQDFVLLGEGISPIAVARGWTFERLCARRLAEGRASVLEPLSVAATGKRPAASSGPSTSAKRGKGGKPGTADLPERERASSRARGGASAAASNSATAAAADAAADATAEAVADAAAPAPATSLPFPIAKECRRVVYSSMEALKPQPDVLYWPKSRNEESLDALYFDGPHKVLYVFQITVAQKHDVKLRGLEKAWAAFGGATKVGEVQLVFVLPNSTAARTQFAVAQRVVTVDGAELQRRRPLEKQLTQWRCFVPPTYGARKNPTPAP